MTRDTEQLLGFGTDESGSRVLRHEVFENKRFDKLVFGPVNYDDPPLLVENVEFRNCSVGPGTFAIRCGVEVRKVTLDQVVSSDSLMVSSAAILDRLVLKGQKKSGGIWMTKDKPGDPCFDERYHHRLDEALSSIELALDISDYWGGEVTILGYPIEKIAINPCFHVAVFADWKSKVDWSQLSIPPNSFWRMRLRYLNKLNYEEGVFSLPSESDRRFKETRTEAGILRDVGVLGSTIDPWL